MFKLAHKNDTHEMLENSSANHTDKTRFDLASLIFGGVGDGTEGAKNWLPHSLKRRASFDWAAANADTQSVEAQYANQASDIEYDRHSSPPTPRSDATVLLGPKPSYYPIYIRQPTREGSQLFRGNNGRVNESFATYTPMKGNLQEPVADKLVRGTPELSGSKIWPVSGGSQFFNLPRAPVNSGDNPARNPSSKATHVHLHALPAKTKFMTTLHIHNMRSCELGALLWALTFGDIDALNGKSGKFRHRIGMGKPYGMGEIGIIIKNVTLAANKGDVSPSVATDCVKKFETEMNVACAQIASESGRKWKKGGMAIQMPNDIWRQTIQVEALIKAATVDPNATHVYMALADFVAAKKDGHFLKPFADDGFELARAPILADAPIVETARTLVQGFAYLDDAPIVRNRDQAEGFLRARAHGGTWYASFNGGPRELVHPDDVTVTGPPDE